MVSEVHMNYPSIAASGKHFTTLWVMSAASLVYIIVGLKVGVEALIRGPSTSDTSLERGPEGFVFFLFLFFFVIQNLNHF